MSTNTIIRRMEKRIRSSREYDQWRRRNLAPACFGCDSDDSLQVHHVVQLYHILLGLLRLYGNEDTVILHALAMHESDRCEEVTLCKACHEKHHPGKSTAVEGNPIVLGKWAVVPRRIDTPFRLGTGPGTGLGLLDLQCLFGIGHEILRGKIDSRIVDVNLRSFARILGKAPGTSFERSFVRSMDVLTKEGFVAGCHVASRTAEIHPANDYLDIISDNPWFLTMRDIRTNKMSILVLRWLLSHQCRKRRYSIDIRKLGKSMGIKSTRQSVIQGIVSNACTDTPWLNVRFEDGSAVFKIYRKGATPIWSLRKVAVEMAGL